MKKYNYVYRITNKIEQKHYYGVRGCNVEPKMDLGIKYFSSSHDKEFIKEQKNYTENYKYKIVRICANREEADILEIKLQEKFNVAKSESFYNRAKRTSTGFSRADVKLSPETRLKMSEAMKGKEHTPETKLKMSEAHQNMSDETRKKMSEAAKGVPKSDEARRKMSEAKQNMSDETKLKMSESRKGVPLSDEHRLKIGEAQKGVPLGTQKQVQCPHCGKIGGISNMKRWHFDNCKYKESEEC